MKIVKSGIKRGVIELESDAESMKEWRWHEEAVKLIHEQHATDVDVQQIHTFGRFSWCKKVGKPGTYIIHYTV